MASRYGCTAALTLCAILSLALHIPALLYARLCMPAFLMLYIPPVIDGLLAFGAVTAFRSTPVAEKVIKRVLFADMLCLCTVTVAHALWMVHVWIWG